MSYNRKYPEKTIYMISGEELNRVLTCIDAILRSFAEGTEDYAVINDLKLKLSKKISYEDLLDQMGIPKVEGSMAPGQEEMAFHKFLGEFGLKPANKSKNK